MMKAISGIGALVLASLAVAALAAPPVNTMPRRTQASTAQIVNALKLAGFTGAALDRASVAVSVAVPVVPKAHVAFYDFEVVDPATNLGVMLFSANPNALVSWDFVAGSAYLLDCEIQPNTTGVHAVSVSFDTVEHQSAEVTGGHIVFAVPAKPGGGTRSASIYGAKGQTFFHGCTITRVVK